MSRTGRNRLFWPVAAAGLLLSAACSRTAHFNVTRPAMLNAAQVGNTMSVGGFNHNGNVQAAAEIVADLQNRITHSLNPSIRLVAAGGGVVITGSVLGDQYGERIERINRTCSRQVQSGRDAQGRTQYRTESYTCTDINRIGEALSRIQFNITNGTDGTVIFDRTYENGDRVVTTGRESPYENYPPPGINGPGILHAVRASNVNNFARVILPWQETVSVDFEDCDGDSRCRQGFEMVQAGNLEGAEGLFTAVLGNYASATAPVPPDATERVGEALYNRGVTRGYRGNYAGGAMDLTRAIRLRPDESDWNRPLQDIQRMQQDQEALRQQGAHAAQQQNVQQAGSP